MLWRKGIKRTCAFILSNFKTDVSHSRSCTWPFTQIKYHILKCLGMTAKESFLNIATWIQQGDVQWPITFQHVGNPFICSTWPPDDIFSMVYVPSIESLHAEHSILSPYPISYSHGHKLNLVYRIFIGSKSHDLLAPVFEICWVLVHPNV